MAAAEDSAAPASSYKAKVGGLLAAAAATADDDDDDDGLEMYRDIEVLKNVTCSTDLPALLSLDTISVLDWDRGKQI
ncbi:hypothetical protein JRQ81_012809 [Phrynocephalus forsythii]|uniref:Uncharacterized protein n=1 Tax=Phrynocephalus forsythii TaxID=171643 RepID=A0A9Q0Y2X1_9SAUR|nr:hypothetical protein JRQ81_012809 [Phrynocephalus forsythii]